MTNAMKNDATQQIISQVDLFGMEYDYMYIYTLYIYNINKTFPSLKHLVISSNTKCLILGKNILNAN